MQKFAIFGNPIKHSKSSIFYKYFANKLNIKIQYKKILTSVNNFDNVFYNFFNSGGIGANITLPFKEIAFYKVDILTERAKLAGSINTVKKIHNNKLIGDNTDGIGLIMDLKYLGFIKKKNINILIIGAGGTARSIISSLLKYGCQITVTNRTYNRAIQLKSFFSKKGKNINIVQPISLNTIKYHLIINATSASMLGKLPDIPISIFKKNISYYDISYGTKQSPFITLAKQSGAINIADGIGMLAHQAAYAFKLWYGKLINPIFLLKKLKKINNKY